MAVVNTANSFVNNEQITSVKLNNIMDNSFFIPDAVVSNQGLQVTAGGQLQIPNGNISTALIGDSQVTTAKIADSNITTAKIADGAVTTIKIPDSNITTDKIANSAVTNSKLSLDWVSFTPVFTLVSGGSVGNAVRVGKYARIGNTVVFWASFTYGSTTSFSGLSEIEMTLPVAATSDLRGVIANVNLYDSSAFTSYPGGMFIKNTTTAFVKCTSTSGAYAVYHPIYGFQPFPFFTDDVIQVNGTYEAA
jgi:hypothetical protein